MPDVAALVHELQQYRRICFYPSSGTDLGDLDFLCSGQKPWSERAESPPHERRTTDDGADVPDLFVHTEINFFQEFAGGLALQPDEHGMHGPLEVVRFRELPTIPTPNRIYDNFAHSGRVFEYKLRAWGRAHETTLIYVLCENEFLVARVLLPHRINTAVVWSRNWSGGRTHGTWLANTFAQLHTERLYADWLCIPGRRGQPQNRRVTEQYPELMANAPSPLVRREDLRWIDEGANGWIEAFDVERPQTP